MPLIGRDGMAKLVVKKWLACAVKLRTVIDVSVGETSRILLVRTARNCKY